MSRFPILVGVALAVSCGTGAPPPATSPPSAATAPPPASTMAAPSAATPAEQPPSTETSTPWRIQSGRVGAIEIGKPLPAELLSRDLATSYIARYIADAQPAEGFRFDDPPLTVLLAGGPFEERLRKAKRAMDPPVAELRDKGAAAARAGAKVRGIMIHAAGPVTEAGVGVGSTLDALMKAYPDAKLAPQPETLGDDVCAARTPGLVEVSFVFASCAAAKKGAGVARVDVWGTE